MRSLVSSLNLAKAKDIDAIFNTPKVLKLTDDEIDDLVKEYKKLIPHINEVGLKSRVYDNKKLYKVYTKQEFFKLDAGFILEYIQSNYDYKDYADYFIDYIYEHYSEERAEYILENYNAIEYILENRKSMAIPFIWDTLQKLKRKWDK